MKNIILLFLCSITLSCSNQLRTVYLRPLGNPSPTIYVKSHHLSQDTTRLYYKIPSEFIVCARNPHTMRYNGRAIVNCDFYPYPTATHIEFQSSHTIEIDSTHIPIDGFCGYFDIAVPQGEKYTLRITINDANSPQKKEAMFFIDKKSDYSPSLFLLKDSSGGIIYDNFTSQDDSISIHIAQGYVPYIYVTRYNSQTRHAAPSYVIGADDSEKFKTDTTFVIENGEKVVLSPQGLYVLRTDSSHRRGYCLLSSYKGFPAITQREALIPAMRYICSDDEYNRIRYSPYSKREIERLWINTAGSLPAAQSMLREYYRRTEYANRYFSSYKEGVLTDQGMIYILYGPPSKIYQASTSQRWVYGDEASGLDVSYVFDKVDNPFADDVYVLQRNLNHKSQWDTAVKSWRKGQIYDNNMIKKIQEEYDRQRYYDTYHIWY
ncbi:MAG: GWxTD domain-containing protein [Flavobacteriales bacterium]|nr:GWxTD domain-containing protein [Flavobacteriales bacterium]